MHSNEDIYTYTSMHVHAHASNVLITLTNHGVGPLCQQPSDQVHLTALHCLDERRFRSSVGDGVLLTVILGGGVVIWLGIIL